MTDGDLVHLKGMTGLKRLSLPEKIGDAGMRHLAELVNLERLNLIKTGVTDEGLQHLSKLTKLREVFVGETKVTPLGVETLKEMLPGADVFK